MQQADIQEVVSRAAKAMEVKVEPKVAERQFSGHIALGLALAAMTWAVYPGKGDAPDKIQLGFRSVTNDLRSEVEKKRQALAEEFADDPNVIILET